MRALDLCHVSAHGFFVSPVASVPDVRSCLRVACKVFADIESLFKSQATRLLIVAQNRELTVDRQTLRP